MSKFNWEVTRGGATYFVILDPRQVTVGSGWGQTESAGMCTHAEFIAGTYQDVVKEHMGEDTLAEVLAALAERS